jgi:sensor histidine kinase YesM
VETNIPSMLLQPFIENALIHGISPKAGMGYIHIFFRKEGDKLICEITDNGIGRTAASEKSKSAEHQSKATVIITEYLKALNKKDQADLFTIQIIDLFDAENISSGTRVIISMPYSKIW